MSGMEDGVKKGKPPKDAGDVRPAIDPLEEAPAAVAGSQEPDGHFLTRHRQHIFTLLEIGFIMAWVLFVARAYLNFNPNLWPNGREFGMAIQTHYIWTQLFECGSCMLWNGSINGGAPAFAELHGAVLHPLVIIPTILFGGVNGAKIGLLGALTMAGLGQWWLAKAMRLGVVARLWAAMMVVVGGHLAGRMDIGVFAIVLSTAAASLVIAAGVDLALTGRRRSAVLLGITLALAIVAGQGYMQVGLLLAIMPAFIVLLLDERFRLKKVWPEFALAGGLAVLLAGVFLVPLIHFWPNFGKDLDASFGGAQSLGNTVLNLVINDLSFYYQGALGTNPYPYQYVIFSGWIPVILAILALRLVPKRQTRLLTFFILAIFLVLLAASGVMLGWLAAINEQLAYFVRIPSLIAGLVVPLVLALAAWSANILLHKDWPLTVSGPRDAGENESESGQTAVTIPLSWVVVGILLLTALYTSFTFSSQWLHLNEFDPTLAQVVDEATALTSGEVQWIQFPFGEHFWAPPAFEQGLKVTRLIRPWHWKNREDPPPFLAVSAEAANGQGPGYLGTVGGLGFEENSDQPYAFVYTDEQIFPCSAQAQGGKVDVTCSTTEAGTLVLQENQFPGWSVRRDGQAADLEPSPWLSSTAPAGEHSYSFHYRPWDVPLGLIISLSGILICIWLWFFRFKTA